MHSFVHLGRGRSLALWLIVGGLSGCSTPADRAPETGAREYAIAGPLVARPFEFRGRTVLEFSSEPRWVEVRGADGSLIPIERIGRFVRLPRVLSAFSVVADGRRMSVVDEPAMPAAAPIGAKPAVSTKPAAVVASPPTPPQAALPAASPTSAGAAPAPSIQTFVFQPGADRLSEPALVTAGFLGAAAGQIEVRGYADRMDGSAASRRLALGRALHLRQALMQAGVPSAAIFVRFRAAAGSGAEARRVAAASGRAVVILRPSAV